MKVKFGPNQVQTQLAQTVSNFFGIRKLTAMLTKACKLCSPLLLTHKFLKTHCDNVLPHVPVLFFTIYCKESMYSMFKDKLQNCSLHQTEYLHNDTSETEVNVIISLNNASEKF